MLQFWQLRIFHRSVVGSLWSKIEYSWISRDGFVLSTLTKGTSMYWNWKVKKVENDKMMVEKEGNVDEVDGTSI